MSSNFETGHAKNVANFSSLTAYCTSYGTDYNPSNSDITLEELSRIQTDAQNAVRAVNASLPAYNTAIAAREIVFEPVSKLLTRVVNALKSSGATQALVNNAKTIVRKLQGRRKTPKLTEEEKQELKAEGKEVNEISASQHSFDSRIDNFDKLINLLTAIPEYSPNETELQVSSLSTLLGELRSKNDAVVMAAAPLSNARITRNELLYNEGDGLVDIAQDVKSYVKSLYGGTSPQYRQISGLEFRRIKN